MIIFNLKNMFITLLLNSWDYCQFQKYLLLLNTIDFLLLKHTSLSPGEGNGYPLQCSYLENSMDRGAWWIIVHGVTKSWPWLSTAQWTAEIHSWGFGGWEVPGHVGGTFSVCWEPASCFIQKRMVLFSLCPRVAEGTRELSGVPFIRALISFLRASPSWPNHPPKTPPPIPSCWELGL